MLALAAALVTGSSLLAACGGGGNDNVLVWYINPDVGNLDPSLGGQAFLAQQCSNQSGGAYKISVQLLPTSASDQREQLIRRLAAQDSSIDLMSLDPPFMPEAANAGFLSPAPKDMAPALSANILDGALEQATFEDTLYAAPFWANTQLLWYKKDVAEKAGLDVSQPVTWDQVINAAVDQNVKIGVQADRYEGYAVWINALISSAGGDIVPTDAGRDAEPNVDSPAGVDAAKIIEKLAHSAAAAIGMSTAEETESLLTFTGPEGGFMVNWIYVFNDASTQALVKDDNLGWTRYPQTVAGKTSTPPLGGIDLAVSAYSDNTDLAWQAAKCITSEQMQKTYFLNSGNPAANGKVYDDPEVQKAYPMYQLIRDSIDGSAPRPVTPYWTDISTSLVDVFHSPSSVTPSTPEAANTLIRNVLRGDALI